MTTLLTVRSHRNFIWVTSRPFEAQSSQNYYSGVKNVFSTLKLQYLFQADIF